MRRLSLSFRTVLLAAAALLAGCGGSGGFGLAAPQNSRTLSAPLSENAIVPAGAALTTSTLCPAPVDPERAACLGTVRVAQSSATASQPIGGLRPTDLASLYDYAPPSQQRATTATVGVVVAGDYPAAEADLAKYRAQYGLPPCTSANGCFRKVGAAAPLSVARAASPESVSANPTGSNDPGWAAETDSDIEAISAVCATCRIVVSEAASNQISDLGVAVSAAVRAGATIVDASFGAPESSSLLPYESLFEPAGAKVIAASGDSGPGVMFPAAATNVVAVAGTTVHVMGVLAYESQWTGSGGGCSAYFTRPSWQFTLGCSRRSVADVAAVGDPTTGISSYDSSLGGWGISGGTSVSAPIVAAMWALSGSTTAPPGAQPLYQHPLNFLSVALGGTVSGLGTPNGLFGF